jgi:hypothetical protein
MASGMNDVTATSLSFRDRPEQALEAYQVQGFFIEPALFSEAACDWLIAQGEQLPPVIPGEARPVIQPHRARPAFLDAMRAPPLVAIMKRLCGASVDGLQSEFFFGRPGTAGFAPHQDNYFVEAPFGAFASAWLALVDIGPENGGLIIYPGTHGRMLAVRPLQAQPSPNQDPNARAQEAILPPDVRGFDVRVRKGDCVLLHGCVAHASHDNCTDQSRYVLLNTYIRHGETFRAGRYASRAPVPLDA